MTADEALKSLKLKFESGNNVPVERATITREEYEPIMSVVTEVLAEREIDRLIAESR